MIRRRRHSELTVSLFPFLSILACVIGTLTLMIAALALGELASSANTHPGAISQSELSLLVRRIAASGRELSDALAQQRQLTALQQRLQEHGFDTDVNAQRLTAQIEDRRHFARLQRLREEREAEIGVLRASALVVEREIRDQPTVAEDAPVLILPRGSGPALTPYFVECRQSGVRIRRKNGTWSEEWRLDDLVDRGRYKVFLEEVRFRGNASAIFLVRPDGVETFRRAELLASSQYVRHGKLAIPGTGAIDFRRYDSTTRDPGAS